MLIVSKAVGMLLTPPGLIVVLAVLGLLLQFRWRYTGLAFLTASTLTLIVLSLPVTGLYLMRSLEAQEVVTAPETLSKHAGAIVVLGGGRNTNAVEYGGETINGSTLERLRYAAHLHRASGLPLLVSGGSVFGEAASEAELMQQVLNTDFRTPAKWVEGRSRTTHENALYSRAILEAAGIRHIVLVTHASHMPRAVWAFREAGFEVLPGPTAYTTTAGRETVLDWLPSITGLAFSSRAIHEHIGLLWYRLAHRAPTPRAQPAQ